MKTGKHLILIVSLLMVALIGGAIPFGSAQDSDPYARRLVRRSSDPSSAVEGQLYQNTTSHSPKFYNGSAWRTFASIEGLQSTATNSCSDAGASDAYACSLSPAIAAYSTSQTVWFKANTANTGAATLNLNSLGAKTIKKNKDSDLADNDIKAGQWVAVVYDGTNFQMLSPVSNTSSGSTGTTSVLFSSTSVNLNDGTSAKQALYTCPANRYCIVTNIVVHHFSGLGSAAQFTFGWDAGASDLSVNAVSLASWGVTTDNYLSLASGDLANNMAYLAVPGAIGHAGDVLGLSNGTPEGSALTARVDVYGYLTDASGSPVANISVP